ncbi:DUF1513 domain-containing protein [Hoeflea sp.]|uniref:DUF1513 domain-containing protein n=1 Tax=Hoeflea sp. TaxID=1940281 RepID=UPI003B51B41E
MVRALERRAFLAGAGAAFVAGLSPRSADAFDRSEMLFATAYMDESRSYGFALVNQQGELVYRETMPGRAHGFTWSEQAGKAVAFARRPGTFAIAFDPIHRNPPVLFHTPEGRHFYGHGVFSRDGQTLYAAENAFDAGLGKIGIYDARGSFARIGELDTYGVGPHEIIMMPDGRTLAVANGGIRTHPDFGRAKLNLAEMRSQIVFINARTGERRGDFGVNSEDQRMSLRHMVPGRDGSLWIGGQYQGDALAPVSPVLRLDGNGDLRPIEMPEPAAAILSDYVGAVAISPDGRFATFSSPKGGGYVTIDVATRMPVAQLTQPRTSGIAAGSAGVIASSEHGRIGLNDHPLHWDNHITAIG